MEFLPWSKKLLNESLDVYNNEKRLSILDLELGGACNMKCVYCDTPTRTMQIKYSLLDIKTLLSCKAFSWLFICGLGEPTAKKNIQNLKTLLHYCEEYNVKCCMFSNILDFDDELFSYVDKGILFPMFKLDSFSPELIMDIYGITYATAQKQIQHIHEMPKHATVHNGYTNICASIVPTEKNKNKLNDIVDWCYDNNIFPLIGDLEDAGKGQALFNELKVQDEELTLLAKHIAKKTGSNYSIPICPSVLFGIHINYCGDIVVDELSGLSCHWFWMTEPKIKILANLKDFDYSELSSLIINNRIFRKEKLYSLLNDRNRLVFGGCGGDVVDLLNFYLKNM